MKNLILALIIGTSVLNYSCKKDEVEVAPQPTGTPLLGNFVVPDNDKIIFNMYSDSVKVKHEHRGPFKFEKKYKMDEVNMIITSGKYYVRLKTYAKGEDTYVSYFLADTKESNIIYGYVGILKRVK